MIIDTSALIAILTAEDDAATYADALTQASAKLISAPTYLETCMVFCGRRNPGSVAEVDDLLRFAEISIRPFDRQTTDVAVGAFLRYGKGRGHPAQLNFGDCISYAMSKVEAMPLLFKGDDFRLTDVEVAL
jgi:ribonuclease VapC